MNMYIKQSRIAALSACLWAAVVTFSSPVIAFEGVPSKLRLIADISALRSDPVLQSLPSSQRDLLVSSFENINQAAAKLRPDSNIWNQRVVLYTQPMTGSPEKSGKVYTGFNPEVLQPGLSSELARAKQLGLKAITSEASFTVENLPKIVSLVMPVEPDLLDISWMRTPANSPLPDGIAIYKKKLERDANLGYNGQAQKLPLPVRERVVNLANEIIPLVPEKKQSPSVISHLLKDIFELAIMSYRIDTNYRAESLGLDKLARVSKALGDLVYLSSYGQASVNRYWFASEKTGRPGEVGVIEFVTCAQAASIPLVGATLDGFNGSGFNAWALSRLREKGDSLLAGIEAGINEQKIVEGRQPIAELRQRKAEGEQRIAEGEREIAELRQQKAEGEREIAELRQQKAEGEREIAELRQRKAEGRAAIALMNQIMSSSDQFHAAYNQFKKREISRSRLLDAYKNLMQYESQVGILHDDEQAATKNYFLSARRKLEE